MYKKMVLIYDVETKWYGNYDTREDELRTISLYDVEEKKMFFYTYKQKDEIQRLFDQHKIIIGFNNWAYDDPIIKKAGIDLRYHINIDLYEVVKKRGRYIGLPEGTSLSLSNIAKKLGLTQNKTSFDYKLLLKDEWTEEEIKLIREYNEQDVRVTTELYEKLIIFFERFKELLSPSDQENMSWLKSSMSHAGDRILNFVQMQTNGYF